MLRHKETKEGEITSRDRLFEILTVNADDCFLMLSGENLNVEYVSPNIERVIGISVKEAEKSVNNLSMVKYIDDKEVSKEDILKIPVGASVTFVGSRDHGRTKEQRFYSETVYHVKESDGDKYIVTISDRTNEILAKQSLEEALAIAKIANQSKSTFLANMSHDIRTPMNTIVGLCTLLQRDVEDKEKLAEHVKHIMLTSRHMLTLINDILDMSKIEADDTALSEGEMSISELVKDINAKIAPQAKAKRQTLSTTVAVRDEKYVGDVLRIKRVLLNVLTNAVQYTPEGGRIEFLIQQIARPSHKYAYLQFTVKDNGIGMSEDFVSRIFEPFTREHMGNGLQGTGLGMPIAKNLVDLMGGTIAVESKSGEGTKVTINFKFPLIKVSDAEFWTEHGISRILVVGGNNIDNNSITWAMRKSGVQISFAKTMKAAYAALEKSMSEGKGYNVVLFDWYGSEKACLSDLKLIRDNLSEYVPLIAFGECGYNEAEAKAVEAGADAFLPNPFLLSSFKDCIVNLKNGKREGVSVNNGKSVFEGLRFLAAEDNELNAMVLSELLKMNGASCVIKVNGREAVDEFVSSKAGYYDAVLMDIVMPIMDGYEATKAIRESEHPSAKTIPVIAMTANAFAEDVKKSIDAGMNAHMRKPIDMGRFEEIVRDLFKDKKEV